MTAADEIHYNDLSVVEKAALDASVRLLEKVIQDRHAIVERVDADQV